MTTLACHTAYLETGSQQGGSDFNIADTINRITLCFKGFTIFLQNIDEVVEINDEFFSCFMDKSLIGWGKNGIREFISIGEERFKETFINVGDFLVGFDVFGPG